MKSKIQKNQILIKGVTIFILVIMILSCLAVVKPNLVMAEEDTEDDVDDPDFTVISSEDSDLDFIEVDSESNSISADLKYLKEQIKKMASYSDIEYNAFMDELKNNKNKIVTVDNELKLRALSIYVAEGNDCSGKTINMTKNIELTSTEEWEPIGSSERPFKGTFNGYGHTISGMLITKQNNNVGLFGYVYRGTIKNIKISKNCTINIPLEIENDINDIVSPAVAKYAYLGAVVGYAKNTSIYNCTNAADVFGGSSVGGIVGCLYNETYIDEEGKEKNEKIRIQDCINTGSVKGLASIGGIVGRVYGTCPYTKDKEGNVLYNYSLVQRCRNTGTIFGVSTNIGGIAGTIKGNSRVYKSENEGQVSTNNEQKYLKINGKTERISPQNVGGIVGSTGGTDKTNRDDISTRIWLSINKGKVFGYSEIGGIVGHLGNSTGGYSEARDCINYTNDIKADRKKEGSTTVYAGKIAGWVGYGDEDDYQKGRVYNCYYQITNNEAKESWYSKTKDIYSDNGIINAIGGYSGPTSGDYFKGGNYAWKLNKNNDIYEFQGKMYNSDGIKSGYTIYYKDNKDTNAWYRNNEKKSIIVGDKKDEDGKTYQPWLYRISNHLEFRGTECVIDNTVPTAVTVNVATASKLDIAVPGDKILFSVKFDENVRYDRDLVLNFKIGTKDKTATFLGIDNDVARFEYTVQKDEGIKETDSDTNVDYLVKNITLSKIVKDTFSITKSFNNDSLTQEGSVIVMSGDQDSPNALYFSSSSEIGTEPLKTTLNTTYKFYDGNYINEKDELFYNKDNFKVKVNINKVLTIDTSSDPVDYKLHVKLYDMRDEVVIPKSSMITKTSSTWIYFKGTNVSEAFNGKSFDNKKIEKIYVTTDEDVSVAVGDDKHISFRLSESNTVINETNTNGQINNINIDTNAPRFTSEYSTKEKYTIGDQINIKLISTEELSSGNALELGVKFNGVDGKGNVKLVSGPTKNDNKTELIYQYIVQDGDNGELSISTGGTIQDLALNETNLNGSTYSGSEKYADTTAPTLNITSNKTNPTNADTITYTFDWSEEVKEFEAKDITIIGGKIKEDTTLVQDTIDKTKYTLQIIPDVVAGNVGDIQVIVEKGACQDIVGYENVRTESVIRVDKQAPILIGLEAYATSDISVNENVDTVKEYYKVGDTVTIIATFSENIENSEVPSLALQFSESGNSKGTVSPGTISGNKITYTYSITSITDGDNGTLSVKGFSGTVLDAAGNATKVTKRALDGDTIIADTKAPTLKALNVTSNKIENKSTDSITIEAVYDEEVYALITKENGTKEIVNITNENAPKLNISFGGVAAKGSSMTAEYATKEDGTLDKTKIEYTYTVVGEEEAGDNGNLEILSYTNNVCDIAGNEAEDNKKVNTNGVSADTIRPQVTNITARVENPRIANTKGDPLGETSYYKEKTVIEILVKYSEPIHEKLLDTIDIAFSENKPTTYKKASIINWNEDENTIRYTYTIENGDNGYLWVKVPEGIAKDEAGNLNFGADAEKLSNIYADTTKPTVTLLRDTTVEQNNQIITIKAQFSENVYNLNNNSREELTTNNTPKLIYSFGTGTTNKEVEGSVSGAVITYEIKKDPVNDNGTLYYELAKGNLCDRAGNEYYQETTDTTAPILEEVVISSNAGMYDPYCKAGTEIYVTATFDEAIAAKNIKLIATIGNVETAEINGEAVAENSKQIRFTYTVKAGDTGKFEIKDICGEIDNQITGENADNTYGWVRDEKGNQNNIYSLADEGITPTGKAEADTKAPYITSIKAKANDKEIATYTKEEGKDAVITVGRTNANIIEYIVTYSEKIPYNHFDRIAVTNGIIKNVQYTNADSNEYKITVQTTVEGVQSLIIPEGTAEDKAGNTDGFVRLDAVTVDFTKPTVRFISEYNGGIYVLPTNIGKVEIRPNVEISEDIATIEYKWDDGEYKTIDNYSSSSDIAIPTKAFTEAGEYVLSIRVKDLAGNVAETSKAYTVINSNINIELSTSEYTNQDITATVSFGNGLTDNRKVTFKAEGSNEVVELNAKGTNEKGIEYTIGTNGTIYAEATDKVGNKVFIEEPISKIDKEDPIVEFEINGENLVIGTGKDKATIKTRVEVEDANLKDIKYIYSNNETLTDEEKAAMKTTDNYGEVKTTDAVEGTNYLHVLATDKAGNETEYKSLPFNVANSNIVKDDEGNITFTPAEENTIKFERQQQFIYVTYGSTLSEEQNVTFTNEDDGYTLDGHAQVLKPTTVTATANDVCGNTVIATYVVESVEGPKFEVIGNPKDWTNQNVKLEVSTYDALKALTVNGEDILSKEENIRSNIVVSENGDYEFIATDTYGNISKKTIKVEKIDKGLPVISKVENEGKDITITATDELSGVAEYAITSTTEIPVEWSKSNVIKTTKDGTFYAWAKDNAGNISRAENVIVVDTTAPTITFNYNSLTINVGGALETNITTDEDAIISYSWDNKTWTSSEDYVRSQKVVKTPTTAGSYTLYAKAADKSGNTSKVQTIEFTVVENPDNIKVPEIIFEDLPTIQVDGIKYVKVSADMTAESITGKMNKDALCEATPKYTKLTSDNKLKTGSEITINDETKYVIVVNGDTNCDGKVSPIDVTTANSIRLNKVKANIIQKLAADFDLDGVIKPIDITMINSYRLGKIKGI